MAISLYDATVAAYLQIARAASIWLDKGPAHCRKTDAHAVARCQACVGWGDSAAASMLQ